ncbi:MAG: homoserine kinase [Veillonella sp.]|uniref:homoserine kinase n=1 Tax=Veillonella sp. TaxID=1926307 RepID=UPI0025DD6F6B|nr:homoserine kinase [Veillonella sp.]MBS4912772.1 homoserine kinase [Veillonella sp.]
METIRVRVPATSANCGPGFDCLGLALELYNTFTFTHDAGSTANTYSFTGFDAELLEKEDQSQNLVGRAMDVVFAEAGEAPQYGHIHSDTNIPPSRGLGSSSTAIVAGLLLANKLLKKPLSKERLVELANRIEGHPDNVAPALLGNLICAVNAEAGLFYTSVMIPTDVFFAVAVPEVTVSTEYARSVLPKEISHHEATANVSHAALFVTALQQDKPEFLKVALEDYLHVPYRKKLIPHCEDVFNAALAKGAHGATISGSGSTLIAYCPASAAADVAEAMKNVFETNGIACKSYVLKPDTIGAAYV